MSTAIIGAHGYQPTPSRAAVRPATEARPAPRLRLTRRGRGVLLALAATPIVIAAFLFSLNGGGATASLDGTTEFQYVTVDAGQTLWEVAEAVAPTSDPRD